MRRRFAVAAAALALSVALTVPAYAGTWKYVNDQWKYQKGTNKFAYNEWIKDNGKYYYIGNDGIMKTGWQQIDGQWYYLDQTGAMQIGWLKSDDGKWYFLYPNGAMAVNTVIDGRTIGEDGVWVPNEGDTEPANSMDLENGYLTISAEKGLDKDEKEKESGRYIRKERYAGACSRSFYVGEDITEEDIKAEFKHGLLKLFVPKKEAKPAVEQKKTISIEG